ncbi:hypothetical protein EsH8_III_001374 [Colletotrichum jinshuiense]
MPPDESVGPVWLAVSSTLLALLLITTALRLWVRFGRQNAGWDDWTIVAAAFAATVRYVFGVMQSYHGNGRHRVYLSDNDYININMYGWWGQLFHFSSMALLKVSICLLILRIKSTRTLKIIMYTIMGGSIFFNFGVVLILLAECRPAGFWRGKSAECWPNKIRIYAIWVTIAYSVLSDLLCSLLPLVVVWNVKIPCPKKTLITGLMSLGLISTAFGIARAESLGVSDNDLSWTFCITAIWSNLELFLGITAANLALSRAILLYFIPRMDKTLPRDPSIPSIHGYIHSELRSDRYEIPSTTISSGHGRSSDTSSSNSDTPLEPGIQKKIEFWWTEDGIPQRTSV